MKNLTKMTLALAGAGLGSVSGVSHAAIMSGSGTYPRAFASQAAAAGTVQIVNANVTATSNVALTAATAPQVTFTLPTGVTFSANPSASTQGATICTVAYAGGGAGSSTVTFNVTSVSAASQCAVSLGDFTLNGATALATAGSSITLTALFSSETSATGATVVATSLSALSVTATPVAVSVSVPPPSNATRFTASTVGVSTSAPNATVTIQDSGTLLASNGTTTYAFTSTSAGLTVAGNFTGITSAYISATGAGSCAATVPSGAVVGTVSGTLISFAGVAPSATARTVCLQATGASLLPAYTGGAITATQDSSSTVAANNAGNQSYSNGTVTTIPYVVGSSSGYGQYFRVTNPGTTSTAVIATVTPDAGGSFSGVVAPALAAGTNALYSIGDVNAATGSSISSSGSRATVSILTSAVGATAEGLILNPDGSVIPYTAIKSGNP